jgi:hypothetical protein
LNKEYCGKKISFWNNEIYVCRKLSLHLAWKCVMEMEVLLHSFLGAFAKLRKAIISFVMSVRPSLRMEQFVSHLMNFHKIQYRVFFENLPRKSSSIEIWQEWRVLCMKTYVHLYFAEFFKKWEIFKTKVVEKIRTHTLYSITFYKRRVKKCGRTRQVADDNIIRRMRIACLVITATKTHTGYLMGFFHCNSGFANAPYCYVCQYIAWLVSLGTEWRWVVGFKPRHAHLLQIYLFSTWSSIFVTWKHNHLFLQECHFV